MSKITNITMAAAILTTAVFGTAASAFASNDDRGYYPGAFPTGQHYANTGEFQQGQPAQRRAANVDRMATGSISNAPAHTVRAPLADLLRSQTRQPDAGSYSPSPY